MLMKFESCPSCWESQRCLPSSCSGMVLSLIVCGVSREKRVFAPWWKNMVRANDSWFQKFYAVYIWIHDLLRRHKSKWPCKHMIVNWIIVVFSGYLLTSMKLSNHVPDHSHEQQARQGLHGRIAPQGLECSRLVFDSMQCQYQQVRQSINIRVLIRITAHKSLK